MFRVGNSLLAFALVLVLCVGGLAHAVIPHDDGDHEHSSTEIIWGSLHSAMQHEDKFLVTAAVELFIVSIFIVGIYCLQLFVPVGIEARDARRIHARRGIAKYRKFR
ncbi:MAG: hypothetical protein NT019_03415 [Candidatus Adlerbacteria bacterium]|nr:hypothetical protein [Candidatus Adlerbacteria bacterium]